MTGDPTFGILHSPQKSERAPYSALLLIHSTSVTLHLQISVDPFHRGVVVGRTQVSLIILIMGLTLFCSRTIIIISDTRHLSYDSRKRV